MLDAIHRRWPFGAHGAPCPAALLSHTVDSAMTDVDLLVTHLIKLESDLALPSGFLIGLPTESDWSFTIKTHALLEAALSQAILAEVNDPRLDKLLGSLPTYRKIEHAKALGLLAKPHLDFIKRFAKIRDVVVHKLESLSFTFADHVAHLAPDDRRNTLNELLFLADRSGGKAGETFSTKPRLVLWAHALAIVTELVAHKATAAVTAQLKADYLEFAEQALGPVKKP
jgi:hypothetical protein